MNAGIISLGVGRLLSYTPTSSMPLHPKAREFAKSGLFAGVKSFADLEKRIGAISNNKEKAWSLAHLEF